MHVSTRNNLRRARSKHIGRVTGIGPSVDHGIGNGEFQLVLPLTDDGNDAVRSFVRIFMSRDEVTSLTQLLTEALRVHR